MVMDQPKQGSGSKLLGKLVLNSAHYQTLKNLKLASILQQGWEENHNCLSPGIYLGLSPEKLLIFLA